MSVDMERLIIETVVKELAARGMVNQAVRPAAASCVNGNIENGVISLPPAGGIDVDNPCNLEALKTMRTLTPARICIGRAGARPKTMSWLRLLADHSVAMDAVFQDVSQEFLDKTGLFTVESAAKTKDDFLTHPEMGRKLSPEAEQIIREKCTRDVQVQIIAVDGLSSSAIEANVGDMLPAMLQGLQTAGIKTGTPFFVRNGRVWIQDPIAKLVNADVIVSLIGERPGLVTAESMSAYMIYRPNDATVEADRTVVSNIHRGGIPPAEAGAHLVTVIKQILQHQCSGVKLQQLIS